MIRFSSFVIIQFSITIMAKVFVNTIVLFFRHSKNADVLKLEFEKKIQQAKAEIILLKEKLRMIDK